jgi:hypothetical protein
MYMLIDAIMETKHNPVAMNNHPILVSKDDVVFEKKAANQIV